MPGLPDGTSAGAAKPLRDILHAATPGPWEHRVWGHDTDEWPDNRVSVGRVTGHGEAVVINPRYGERTQDLANARLIALAPELAALVLDMGEALAESLQHPDHVSDEVRKERNRHSLALLARLDRIGKEPSDGGGGAK